MFPQQSKPLHPEVIQMLEPEVLVSGRRFARSLFASVAAAAGAGVISDFGLMALTGRVSSRRDRLKELNRAL
jgi:hypothetical protein